VVQTELSPAILVHSASNTLALFAGTTNAGLGAPTYVAWSTPNGPRTFKRHERLEIQHMQECWVLVWWAGAEGWTNWDSPWAIYLQHQPKAMALDDGGLQIQFADAAGDVVLLPLYGYEKLPQRGSNGFARFGPPPRKVHTWDWPEVLKRDPLTRIRYWAALTRELPIAAEEQASIDANQDSITLRWRFERQRIVDDWRTPHLKMAPLPPVLAHAASLGGFPVQFSKPWFDLDFFTPNGPSLAIEAVDQFEATFSVLQYVHETETPPPAQPNGSSVAAEALQQAALWPFDPTVPSNDSLLATLPRALALCGAPTRTNLEQTLGRWLPAQPQERVRETLPGWWAYAHYTGDWKLIKERWPVLRESFSTFGAARWAGSGQERASRPFLAAASCAAFARLAYRMGDADSYRRGCAQFARELVLLFVRQRGASYFREHQPWHSMEIMDDEVFLDHLDSPRPMQPWAGGWDIDGPTYPAARPQRSYKTRWTGFHDVDLARFYRDNLLEPVRRELHWLMDRGDLAAGNAGTPTQRWATMELRSLLLNEKTNVLALAQGTGPHSLDGAPGEIMVGCLALLRTTSPLRFERLIPAAAPSPFAPDGAGDNTRAISQLVTWIRTDTNGRPGGWPELIWPHWHTPSGAPWTFGAVLGGGATEMRVREENLNLTTRVLIFEAAGSQ
jgi:hypothetical protein